MALTIWRVDIWAAAKRAVEMRCELCVQAVAEALKDQRSMVWMVKGVEETGYFEHYFVTKKDAETWREGSA